MLKTLACLIQGKDKQTLACPIQLAWLPKFKLKEKIKIT